MERGGTGSVSRTEANQNLSFMGTDPVTLTSNDTTAIWATKGTGHCFYTINNCLVGQPSQYGILTNFVYASEVFQLFNQQASGGLNYRSGNGNGWNGTSQTTNGWKKLFDNSMTIPVSNGGTGATTFTSGAALIGAGTGAVTTRAITNNTTATAVSGTNLTTCNTVNQHVAKRLNRSDNINAANTAYTTYMARAIAAGTTAPTSLTNGTIFLQY